MSSRDRKIALGIAKSETGNVDEIKKILKIDQNEWNPYRKRLLDKGIINVPERGKVAFTLPFFREFLLGS
jgi:predicted transcriptional regulator